MFTTYIITKRVRINIQNNEQVAIITQKGVRISIQNNEQVAIITQKKEWNKYKQNYKLAQSSRLGLTL